MTMLGAPIPVVDAIVAAIRPMLDATRAERKSVAGLGVSVAGFLNQGRTAMIHNANLPALREFPLRPALEERLSGAHPYEVFEARLKELLAGE